MLCLIILSAALAAALGWPAAAADLRVEGTAFRVTVDGRTLSSPDLVGAVVEMEGPHGETLEVRIDSVTPAAFAPDILLHALSVRGSDAEPWRPLCAPDAYGRRLGFPAWHPGDHVRVWVDGPVTALAVDHPPGGTAP